MQPISLREGIDTQIGAQNEVAKIMAGISAQLQLSQQKMSALGAVLRQSHSASSSDSHLNPEPSQADQEGDFYKRLLKARQEKDAKGQSLWLEKLSELFLARGDFFKAANLLCGACVYARRDEKLRLFKKMEDVEKKYLQTLGCFSNEDHASRIQRQRLFLENQRRQLKQKIKEMDLSDLFMNMPGGLEKLHEVLQTITEYNKKLLEEIVNAAISYLGPPPVKWACMGMGSMARGEMSPYSDIEFAFLIDDASETSLQYFRSLSQCISIMVIHLGETKFPIFSGMDKKHPSVTPSGFSLDTGGNTPLGMPDLYELIGTSADLARFVDKDWIERSIILPNALSAVCLITGDARLVEFFEDERRKVLEQKKEGISNRDRLAYQLLSGHLKEFKPDLSMNKEALRAFGVKPELYRPFQEILGCLALRQSLREKSSVERIQALQRDKIFSDKGANSLRNAVININFLRVKAHLFYQDECDFYLLSVPGETDEKGMLYIDFEDHMRLERIYATLQEFHTCAMTFSQTKKIEVFSQSDFVRLTTREAASKMQALPKKIKGLGGYVMPSNVSMQNLTYEKVRAQLDKMDRQHIGEQEAYQKSLALNPNDWVSAFRLAEHEADHQQNEEALNHYLTASKAVPPDSLHEAAIYHRLANLYYGKNELQKARESLAKALRVQLPLYQQHKTNPAVQSPDVESDHFDVAYDFARMLDAAAGLELTLKNYPTAITYLVLMLEVLPKVKGSMAVHIPMDTIRKMELNCLDVLSVTYLACDKYEEATATTNRWSEAIAVRPGQYEGFEVKFDYVRIKRRLGRIALNQKNYKMAIKYFLEGLARGEEQQKLYKQMKSDVFLEKFEKEVILLHQNLAQAYLDLQEFDNAVNHASAGLKVQIAHSPKDAASIASSHLTLGEALLFQGKYLEAHVAIENATKLMHSKVGNIEHSDLEIYYLWLADSYERVGQYVLAEQHLLRAFKCAADESESAQIQFLFAQGRQQMGLGNFYTALESFEKVNEFYRVNNDEEKMIESFENLASCTYFLNQTERALIFVQKALELNVRLNGNQHRFVADDLLIQAFVYGSRKDFSKALESAGKAQGIIQKIYSREHERMAYCCDCFGQIYVEMAKYKEAMSELNQSLKMRKSMYGKKAHPRTSVTYQNIGKVHEGLGEMNKAVEAYLNAITTWIGASCFEHPGLEECVSRILEIHKKKNVADALKKLHALLKTLGSDHALTKKVAVAMAQR